MQVATLVLLLLSVVSASDSKTQVLASSGDAKRHFKRNRDYTLNISLKRIGSEWYDTGVLNN